MVRRRSVFDTLESNSTKSLLWLFYAKLSWANNTTLRQTKCGNPGGPLYPLFPFVLTPLFTSIHQYLVFFLSLYTLFPLDDFIFFSQMFLFSFVLVHIWLFTLPCCTLLTSLLPHKSLLFLLILYRWSSFITVSFYIILPRLRWPFVHICKESSCELKTFYASSKLLCKFELMCVSCEHLKPSIKPTARA